LLSHSAHSRNPRGRGSKTEDRLRTHRSFDLADRVHALRAKAGLTLKELGLRSGISISALSKIENNQLSPTYEKVMALALGLGVDIATLFADDGSRAVTGRRSVTRKGQGATYNTKNYSYELLCSDLARKRLVPLLAIVKARDMKAFGALQAHHGEEVFYVLEGRVILHSEFYEPIELSAGDCVYLDSRMGHGCVAQGMEDAKLFWVCSSEEPIHDIVRTPKKIGER